MCFRHWVSSPSLSLLLRLFPAFSLTFLLSSAFTPWSFSRSYPCAVFLLTLFYLLGIHSLVLLSPLSPSLVTGHNALGELPPLASMTQLRTLLLPHNRLRAVPPDLPATLRRLDLRSNRIALIAHLQHLVELEWYVCCC